MPRSTQPPRPRSAAFRRLFAGLGVAALVMAGISPAVASPRPQPPISAEVRKQLDADLEAVRATGAIAVVGAVQTGSSQFRAAVGVRTIDRATPARASDTARIASVTKPMVSVLALQEVQRGRWSLATTVGDVLPGLMPGHDDVTLEQLLSHRSGAPDYLAPIIASGTTNEAFVRILSRRFTPRQLIRAALSQPWAFASGTDYGYSNTNYVVVGLMLEKLNRQPVSTLLERRIFRPARMTSTTFQTGRIWGQRAHLAEYAITDRPVNLDRTDASLFYAAGAVESTPRDVNRFWRATLDGTLLRPRWSTEMLKPRTAEPAYGLGVYAIPGPCADLDGKPEPLYGHDGATFGTQTLAFTTADGRTQAGLSWTGRKLLDPDNKDLVAAAGFVRHAVAASCERLVETPPQAPTHRMQDAPLASP